MHQSSEKTNQGGGHQVIFFAKTDVQSAFRLAPLKITQYKWVVMKAEDPETR